MGKGWWDSGLLVGIAELVHSFVLHSFIFQIFTKFFVSETK